MLTLKYKLLSKKEKKSIIHKQTEAEDLSDIEDPDDVNREGDQHMHLAED